MTNFMPGSVSVGRQFPPDIICWGKSNTEMKDISNIYVCVRACVHACVRACVCVCVCVCVHACVYTLKPLLSGHFGTKGWPNLRSSVT